MSPVSTHLEDSIAVDLRSKRVPRFVLQYILVYYGVGHCSIGVGTAGSEGSVDLAASGMRGREYIFNFSDTSTHNPPPSLDLLS